VRGHAVPTYFDAVFSETRKMQAHGKSWGVGKMWRKIIKRNFEGWQANAGQFVWNVQCLTVGKI
jgi:hypothetical protein